MEDKCVYSAMLFRVVPPGKVRPVPHWRDPNVERQGRFRDDNKRVEASEARVPSGLKMGRMVLWFRSSP